MTDETQDEQYSEREASRRFAATVKRTLEMPPQPHKAKRKKRRAKGSKPGAR